MKKDVLHFLSLTTISSILLLVAVPVLAYVVVDSNGNVIVKQGQVLSSNSGSGGGGDDNSGSGSGGDDNSGSGSGEDSSGSGESKEDESAKQAEEKQAEAEKKEAEQAREQARETETESKNGTVTKTKTEDNGEVRTDTRLPDGTRVKTRTSNNKTRTDVYQGGVKVRLERDGDRFRIKSENELGEETELGEDEVVSIDERADRNQVRIRTFNSTEDQLKNRAIIERLNTQALTDLPLSINLETNELTVTTPSGERTVTVLPDQAVQNMLAANVIDKIGGQELVNLVRQGGVETLDQVIQLSEKNGVAVYEIPGVKQHRLLGFFPVTTDVTVTVSAETGEIIDTHQSLFDNIVDILSTTV